MTLRARDWKAELIGAISNFIEVAELGGESIGQNDFEIEFLPAPHRPPTSLPKGKMAVYAFFSDGEWLKIGKVGPASAARYTSQHYNAASARSTLAGSLIRCKEMGAVPDFNPVSAGLWIRERVNRANILLDATQPRELLSLLEAFLHLRLRPRYEG